MAAPPTPTPTPAAGPIVRPTSGLALTSFVLGLVSFFPLVGVLLGILAVVFGLLALGDVRKGAAGGKGLAIAGCVLGVLGVVWTVALYSALFYFGFFANVGPFVEVRDQVTQQMLTQNAGALELYKKKFGHYPATIKEASDAGFTLYPVDFSQRPIIYKVSPDQQSYDMRGVGRDGKEGTADDILPKQ